jgi:hypothetical protein
VVTLTALATTEPLVVASATLATPMDPPALRVHLVGSAATIRMETLLPPAVEALAVVTSTEQALAVRACNSRVGSVGEMIAMAQAAQLAVVQ